MKFNKMPVKLNPTYTVFIGIILTTFIISSCNDSRPVPDRPNIVIIFADDLGYGDFSCYGASKIKTPNVDKLAANGIRFTDAHVTSSLCSPSRYSFLTGRYPWRTRLKSGVLGGFAPPLIEEGRTTLASMLNANGYYTAGIGKWHLGFNWALKDSIPRDPGISEVNFWKRVRPNNIDFSKPIKGGPIERGFDYFFGIAGSNGMRPHAFIENENVTMEPSVPDNFSQRTSGLRGPDWDLRNLDRVLTEKAVAVIDNHFSKESNSPFFLYYPTSAVHPPWLPEFTKGQSEAGMRGDKVIEFDWIVGELVKALEKHNSLENTLIIITSDNGPHPGDEVRMVERYKNKTFGEEFDYYQPYFGDYQPEYLGVYNEEKGWLTYDHKTNAGFLGFKSDAWEGGLRVPFVVHWPKKIKGGFVNSNVISSVDLLATMADITGTELREEEGEDSYSFLTNLLDNDAPQVRKSLIMAAGRTGALIVRSGDWKYIEGANPLIWDTTQYYRPNNYPNAPSFMQSQLYNLKDDLFERNDLIDSIPEKASELEAIVSLVKQNKRIEGNEVK